MPTRNDYRRILLNRSSYYKKLLEGRNIKSIRQYASPTMKYPTVEQMADITRSRHVWKIGDRYYKLAIEYYGSAQYWWVIALFNQKPTEADISIGDIIYIPTPLEAVLRMYREG